MKRTLGCAVLLLTLTACQVPPERALPAPLPETVAPRPYHELLQRARAQGLRATEALYVNNWADLEDHSRGLEQTAQFLVKAENVPPRHRDTLPTASADLGKRARLLREAAAARDPKKANELLGRINAQVREMGLSD